MKALDLTGKRFNKLLVTERSENNKHGQTMWNCVCNCGNVTIVQAQNLKSGNTISCGCYNVEKSTIHGRWNKTEYKIWSHMIQRCNNANNPKYHYYGGRGISVCDEWLKFEGFFKDMGINEKADFYINKASELGFRQ